MKSNSNLAKKIVVGVALLMMAGLLNLATAPAGQPLSKDDITLLLLGSSPSSKIIQMVEQRGVDFQMNPDLAKKFHDQGATDELIDALQKAGNKAAAAKASAPAPAPAPAEAGNLNAPAAPEASPEGKPNAPDAPEPRAAEPPPVAAPTVPVAPSSSEPVLHTRQSAAPVATPPASAPSPAPASPSMASSSEPVLHEAAKKEGPTETPVTAGAPGLKDPDTQGIQHIIQEFAAKEKVFREARNNYTYHQINKVEELGSGNEIVGTYEQEWDILYDDSGKRIEKVTYAPLNTLKGLIVTKEDIEGFRNIQPFVLTSDELPEYDIKYLGHVKVDQITAYVFSIRPKEIEKNRQYFQGVVWVDDRDLQIVKSEGKQVPQDKVHHGQENLFPRFTTWREQVDGKFWFPTYTMADDTLYFSNGPPVHMKEVVRYTDYKQFKSSGRILSVESIDKQKDQTAPAATPPKK
jgi:ribosomal protein L12E/L44/L45/RPP1/RPP2